MVRCQLCDGDKIEKIFNPITNRYTTEYKCEDCGAIYTFPSFHSIEDYPRAREFWTSRR